MVELLLSFARRIGPLLPSANVSLIDVLGFDLDSRRLHIVGAVQWECASLDPVKVYTHGRLGARFTGVLIGLQRLTATHLI